jgi:acetyl esterase/lipase
VTDRPQIRAEQVLERLRSLPPDEEVQPGVTAGEMLARFEAMVTPPEAPQGCDYRPEVVYGTGGGRDLKLWLYARPGERSPGIVFIHGGGWVGGHPFMLVRMAAAMAERGYVTATIEYRLSTETTFPGPLSDAKCAVRWMRANADEIGLDPSRLAVAGGSAGGHLAALVALTPGRHEGDGGHDDFASDVRAAVLFNPGLDLRLTGDPTLDGIVTQLLGEPTDERIAEATPLTHVTSASPPFLTRVGDRDRITPASTCERFHGLLDDARVPNRLDVLPGLDHGIPQTDFAGCVEAMTGFLDEHLASSTR